MAPNTRCKFRSTNPYDVLSDDDYDEASETSEILATELAQLPEIQTGVDDSAQYDAEKVETNCLETSPMDEPDECLTPRERERQRRWEEKEREREIRREERRREKERERQCKAEQKAAASE